MSNDDLAHPEVPRTCMYVIRHSSKFISNAGLAKLQNSTTFIIMLDGKLQTLAWDDSVEIRREIGFEVARHGGYLLLSDVQYNNNALTRTPDDEVMHVFIHSRGHCTCGQELGTVFRPVSHTIVPGNLAHMCHCLASRSVTGCSGIANMGGIRFGWLDSRTCDES